MGEIGFASSTAGPTVAGGVVIVGQQVSDNQRRDAPSGVVRAYDVVTGAFRWAWDAKRLDRPGEPLADGEVWPRGTPNVWTVITADEELGLAFLGTGNAANDHFGGNREEADDAFSSAVVAVDLATGATRWSFRTVERDRWDYDIGAPPAVLDLEVDGATRRVVVQATKTGSIFVLDARTGQPVRPVEWRPAPQGGVPGERLAPAQPQSIAYPNFSGAPGPDPEMLDARHAFGLTPIDAAWCRIQFHRMRYEGIYTPPTDRPAGMLLMPGTIGGPNWGGIAVDLGSNVMITNHSRLPNRVRLIPRERVLDPPVGDGGARPDQQVAPQAGAPWGVDRPIWMSPLEVPCISPPWGYIAATDLLTGRLLWSRPLGTGYDMGPLGIPSRLRVPVGTPNIGGAVVTAGGLTFIAAAQDNYLRAFETATGRMLWSGRLPAGGQAGPMTYMHEGRQYVAIGATGHARLQTKEGDSLVVFALDASR
jgi:quinoprotein glucose dehydrogenase